MLSYTNLLIEISSINYYFINDQFPSLQIKVILESNIYQLKFDKVNVDE